MAIGIFALTESISEKSISATAIPVDNRSENRETEPDVKIKPATAASMRATGTESNKRQHFYKIKFPYKSLSLGERDSCSKK